MLVSGDVRKCFQWSEMHQIFTAYSAADVRCNGTNWKCLNSNPDDCGDFWFYFEFVTIFPSELKHCFLDS